MLTSLALIFLTGTLFSALFQRMRLPGLLGMLLAGIVLGPYALNLIDYSILDLSTDLRQIAFLIILIRAGLSLDLNDLKKVGRPAVLMCFLPASLEIAGATWLAPKLLGVSILDGAVIGSVVAAVSPAVILPRMLTFMKQGYGIKKAIPQLIMAGSSVDGIFVVILFTAFTSLSTESQLSFQQFLQVPVSILLGVIVGGGCGFLLSVLYKKIHMRDSVKLIVLLSASFLLISLEKALKGLVPFSGLLAVMVTSMYLLKAYPVLANRISPKFSKLWVATEIMLFVLVGATVNIGYAMTAGIPLILTIFLALLFRIGGVVISLSKTTLLCKERLFCVISYLPKATVQAAVGGIPLAMGLPCGSLALTAAVLSIFLTAPLGALGMDLTYQKLLTKEQP